MAPKEDTDKVRAVTAEKIKAVADTIFRPENCNLALVLPNDSKADPEKLRESIFQKCARLRQQPLKMPTRMRAMTMSITGESMLPCRTCRSCRGSLLVLHVIHG